MKLTFIGAGNMAEAIVAGIIEKQVMEPADICVTDISELRLQHYIEKHGVCTSLDNAAAAAQSDAVVLAVKPQVFPEVGPEIREALTPDTLVISIMAGVPSDRIAGGKPLRVVRIMPNTPALIGEGAAGIAGGALATGEDVQFALRLMEAVGTAVIVSEEQLDAVTALSGSGPAYVFYLLESMLEAARQMGLEDGLARELALSTVIGAARLMQQSGEEAAALRAKVTSKGGTTAAAIDTLEAHGVRESIIAALLAAQARSKELAHG